MIPDDLLYTGQHEWVKVQGHVATVGITSHAQEALGDMTFVELPAVDREFSKGDDVVDLESSKAAASVYAPADGKITQVNQALQDKPELINSDSYGAGWMYKLAISDQGQLSDLMDAAAYEKFLAEQE